MPATRPYCDSGSRSACDWMSEFIVLLQPKEVMIHPTSSDRGRMPSAGDDDQPDETDDGAAEGELAGGVRTASGYGRSTCRPAGPVMVVTIAAMPMM